MGRNNFYVPLCINLLQIAVIKGQQLIKIDYGLQTQVETLLCESLH